MNRSWFVWGYAMIAVLLGCIFVYVLFTPTVEAEVMIGVFSFYIGLITLALRDEGWWA